MGRTGTRHAVAATLLTIAALTGATLRGAPAAGEEPLVYVALGDSFTSGPLVPPFDASRVPVDCGQSLQNYPHLVAAQLGAQLRDVSCGGATIDRFFTAQGPLVTGGVNPPQIDALGPDVDVVTVGIGGNDVGFVGFALDCLRFPAPVQAPCTPEFNPGGVDLMARENADMEEELVVALGKVQAAAPNAVVLVVSYPTSLPDSGVACWPYLPILPEDMPYVVAKFKEMNAALASAAGRAGATYVDIYTPSIGHDACQIPGLAWVNGAVIVPPSFPAHPNVLSYLNSAPVVAGAIRTALAGAASTGAADETEGGTGTTEPRAPSTTAPDAPGGRLPATGGAGPGVGLALGALALAVAGFARRAQG